jgi:hypothetical protein
MKVGTILKNGHGVRVKISRVRPHYGVVCQLLKRDGALARRGRWKNRTWYGREMFIPTSHVGKHWLLGGR